MGVALRHHLQRIGHSHRQDAAVQDRHSRLGDAAKSGGFKQAAVSKLKKEQAANWAEASFNEFIRGDNQPMSGAIARPRKRLQSVREGRRRQC